MERLSSLMGNIGMGFLGLWNRRRLVLPLLLLLAAASWVFYAEAYTFLSFNLAVTVTVLLFTVLLLGTVVVDGIEAGFIPFERVPRVVAGSLAAILSVIGVLVYLALMLARVVPPLPLSFMFAVLFAMEVAPLVSLAIVIPPSLGYFLFRERWRRLRSRIPFWGVYLGLLAALLCAYPILRYPELWFYGGLKPFGTAGALIVLSLLLLAHPREGVARTVGLAFPLVAFISWFTCYGGMALGSVLAILAGACTYSWSPPGSPPMGSPPAAGTEVSTEVNTEVSTEVSPGAEVSPDTAAGGGLEEAVGRIRSLLCSWLPLSRTPEEKPQPEGSSRLMEGEGRNAGGSA